MYKIDSRLIEEGDIYICLPKGEAYSQEALDKGASEVRHMTRKELAVFSNAEFDYPSQKLKVVGITGTNGKTTTAHLVHHCLNQNGASSYLCGTLTSPLTTPESIHLQELMRDHYENGGTHFVMEVSSHAIAQGRVWGIDFDVKLLTNLSQDHLDYHESLEDYHQVKRSFLTPEYGQDTWDNTLSKKDTQFIFPDTYQAESQEIPSQLKGDFNQRNLNAAKSILLALGLSQDRALELLSQAPPPPGRFESIDEGQSFDVIVDFAHTPDGLDNILVEAKTLAEEKKGRLLTLFGCGGDRDKGKRPKMGAVAARYSDLVFVTSDNPRSESEQAIIEDILEGIQNQDHIRVQPDRRQAIRDVLEKAEPNDVVVLAGKGHEDYQVLKGGKIDFDDRKIACEILKETHKKDRVNS